MTYKITKNSNYLLAGSINNKYSETECYFFADKWSGVLLLNALAQVWEHSVPATTLLNIGKMIAYNEYD